MAKVAGYYRVSQARDGMKAPELYEDEIRRFCSFKGYTLTEIFSDIDRSGYNRSESRPALGELVKRRAEFSGVVVPKLSRFGRSVKHLSELFAVFDRDNIALYFLDLGMDTSTSQGRLPRNIMAAIAEYESDVRSDYSKASAHHVASKGGRGTRGESSVSPVIGLVNESGEEQSLYWFCDYSSPFCRWVRLLDCSRE